MSSSKRSDTSGLSLKSFEAATSSIPEAKFANDTVGLVPHAAFVNSRAKAAEHTAKLQQQEKQQKKESLDRQRINDKRRREALLKKRQAKLTFGSDDEEDDDDDDDTTRAAPPLAEKRQRLGFCPGVETSFLPDRDREADEAALREQLKQEYALETARVKAEPLDITYSYWDGSGHRRRVSVTKGSTVGEFLAACQAQLKGDFRAVRSARVENLMYVKEDVILPHHVTFFDLISNKARGKSGPLFHFDVHDDIRLLNDATREKEESHAGKVCDRSWYERNKHIFPASRWETFDERTGYSAPYSIHGHVVR